MSFSCNQCNISLTSAVDVSNHAKGNHVAFLGGSSDEEMESEPESPAPKTSLKRLRENPDEEEGPSTQRLRQVSPKSVTMKEVFDVDASPSPSFVRVPSPPECGEYTQCGNFIVTSPWLDTQGLVINSHLRLFNCIECRQMYTATNIATHLASHKRSTNKVFKVKLAEVISVQDIHSDYPSLSPATVLAQLGGLDMVKEFGCPACPQAGNKATIQQHIRAKHPRQALKPQDNVFTQVLNKGRAKTKLRVTPIDQDEEEDEDSPVVAWKAKYTSFYKNVMDATRAVPNSRYISPWLMRTGWHTLTDNRDPAPLVELVSMPKKNDPLYWVAALVRVYMEDVSNLIPSTSIQTLQRLNSADPDHELNHTPFHLHHQHKETIAKYALPLIHLVCALLRKIPDGFQFASTPSLDTAVKTLRNERSAMALHKVFKELWVHEWPSGVAASFPDPTICFLGLFTLKSTGLFAHPKEVTGTIAKLTRAIQLTILKELHLRKDENPHLHEMREMMKLQVWIKSHEMTTFSDLVSLQKYATRIALSTLGFPKVIFPNRHRRDYDQMLYDGQPISIQNLQEIYTRVQDNAIKLWEEDVLMGLKLRVVYDMIHDNLSSDEPGHCFLDNPNNPFKKYTNALFNAIMDQPALFKEFMMKSPTGEWILNPHRAVKWIQKLDELEMHLLLGTEMKSGAPGRMSELTCSLVRNRNTRMRNVMGVGRYLALIGQYSKNTNNEQMDKMIPRAFSGFEQDMIIQVHAIARPFAMVLAKLLWPEQPEISMNYGEMLFMGFKKEFDPDMVSKLMGKHSSAVTGWSMTVRPHRHIHIAFTGHKCKGLIDNELEKEITSSIHALQSGHSVATERRVYGLDKDNLAGVSENMITLYLDTSRDFQKAFQIPPAGECLPYDQVKMSDFVPDDSVTDPNPTASQGTDLSPVLSMLAKMQESIDNGHKTLLDKITTLEHEISHLKEQRTLGEVYPSGDYDMQSVHDNSDDNNTGLPFTQDHVDSDNDMYVADDSAEPEANQGNKLVMVTPGTHNRLASSSQVDFLDRHHTGTSMLKHLRDLLGQPDAKWRSLQQRSAVDALLKLEQDVIVALPTGIGKSVIAVLPSQVENAVTVIIIPLTALMQDWKRRLTALNVHWEHFEGAKNPTLEGDANIVLVSSDVARNIHWRKAFADLSAKRTVARVVIDEAHYYFTDYNFRKEAMQKPYKLRMAIPFQLVLLSATLPPASRVWLAEQMALTNTLTLTAPSARPELRYILRRGFSTGQAVAEEVRKVIHDCKASIPWGSKDRYMIFATYFDKGKEVADILNLDFYHASSSKHPLNDSARQERMDQWLAGEKEGLICTSALGAGNDYANVRLTIHIGTPPDMVVFNQQSGRAGRDGQEAWCAIIPSGKACGGSCEVTGKFVGAEAMSEITNWNTVWPKSCFRYSSGRVMDGEGKTCVEMPSHFIRCSACTGNACQDSTEMTDDMSDNLWFNELEDVYYMAVASPTAFREKVEQGFDVASDKARTLAGEARNVELQALSKYFGVINCTGEQSCGACFTNGWSKNHAPFQCPYLKGHIDTFKHIRRNIQYPSGWSGPCYKCHIWSGGGDLMHQPMEVETESCERRDVVLPMLTVLWVDTNKRQKMMKHLRVSWTSVEEFVKWLSTPHPEHHTGSMAIMAWIGELETAL